MPTTLDKDSVAQLCLHRLLDGQIHEFRFTQVSRSAVDAWFATLIALMQEPAPACFYFLFDMSDGMQPLGYSMQRMLTFLHQHPHRPPAVIAFLHPPELSFQVIFSLLNRLVPQRQEEMQFFPATERAAALRWLHQRRLQQG